MKKRGKDTIESASEAYVEVAGTRQPVPKIDVNPGPHYADENRRFANVTTVTKTPGGRLWAGFSGGGDGEGHLNYGMVVFSNDDGETWTSPQLVIDTDGDGPIRTDHVVVWTAPDGVLWVMLNQYPEGLCGRRSSLWVITCANPDDEDRCWSAPRKLVDEQNMLNQPTVLRDSTWIFPTGCWIRCSDSTIKESREHFPSHPLISRDSGKTFEFGGPLHGEVTPNFDEYTIAERKDGTLVIYNRHDNKGEKKWSILECESHDQGRSWTPMRVNGIPNATSRLVLMNLQSGSWLLVKHGSMVTTGSAYKGRTYMTAWISRDEGKSWDGGLLLEDRQCAYPSGFQADDGTIYVSYDRKRKEQAEMLLARFTEEDVLAGKGVSKRFALRLLINKTHGISRKMEKKQEDAGKVIPGCEAVPPLQLPTVDISGETERHVVIAQGTEELYQGHPDTELMPDGKTMFCVWTLNHGWGEPFLRRSNDAGLTWEDMDIPEDWNLWNEKSNRPGSSLGGKSRGHLPMIHCLTDPDGKQRLFIFDRGKDDMLIQSVSEDGGTNWSPMRYNGLHGIEPSMNIIPSRDGRKLLMWNTDWSPSVYQAESCDGGLIWSNELEVIDTQGLPGVKMIEPGVIRSPDGSQLLMFIRDFAKARTYNSLYAVSDDDGKTWSKPRRLPPGLTGDRHSPCYAPDGRLIVLMRDTLLNGTSQTVGHFIAWVGRYEDIVAGKDGQYRAKLLHSYAGRDCGYSSIQRLPDDTFVATTYIKYTDGPEYHSVVSSRFKIEELDEYLNAGGKIIKPETMREDT